MRKFSGAFSGFAARVLPRCIQRTKPFAVAQSATESAPVPRATRAYPAVAGKPERPGAFACPRCAQGAESFPHPDLRRSGTARRQEAARKARNALPRNAYIWPGGAESFPHQARPALTRPLPANRSAPALSHARDALKARNLSTSRPATLRHGAAAGSGAQSAKRPAAQCVYLRRGVQGAVSKRQARAGESAPFRRLAVCSNGHRCGGGFARAAFSRAGSPRRCARTPAGEAASGAADARRRPGKAV